MDVVEVVIEHENEHLADRELTHNQVRHAVAIERAFAPGLDGGHEILQRGVVLEHDAVAVRHWITDGINRLGRERIPPGKTRKNGEVGVAHLIVSS